MDHPAHTAMEKRHLVVMVLCCLIPIAAVAAVFLFKIPVSAPVLAVLFLLCPLSHIGLMWVLMSGNREQDHGPSR